MLRNLIRDLSDLRRVQQARKSVNAAVKPLVDGTRERVGDIPEIVWNEPYIIGFMATVISAIAIDATSGKLSGDMLGHVQVSCWQDITGIQNADIGDEILYLSGGPDDGFMSGVEAAAEVLTATDDITPLLLRLAHCGVRRANQPLDHRTVSDAAETLPLLLQRTRTELQMSWCVYFDEPVAALRVAVLKLDPAAQES